jgi:hypothetical protein
MGCSSTGVYLTPGTSGVSIQLNYYQGPATNIALMFLWRYLGTRNRIGTAPPSNTGICTGTSQDNGWFSVGGTGYNDLSTYGWSVIPAANLYLGGGSTNPCSGSSSSSSSSGG